MHQMDARLKKFVYDCNANLVVFSKVATLLLSLKDGNNLFTYGGKVAYI